MGTKPADGRGGGEQVACDWCGRPGHVIQYSVIDGDTGTVHLEKPPLCEVCAGLLGVAPGDPDFTYEAAVREVDLVLIAKYQARQLSNSSE